MQKKLYLDRITNRKYMRAIELSLNTQPAMSDNFLSTFYPANYEWTIGGNGFKSYSFSIHKNTSTYRHALREIYQAPQHTWGAQGQPIAAPVVPTPSVVLDLKKSFEHFGYATLAEILKVFFEIAGSDSFDQYTVVSRNEEFGFSDLAKYNYARRAAAHVDFDAIVKQNLAFFKERCLDIPGVKFKVIKPNSRNYFLNYGAFLGNTCIALLKPQIFTTDWNVENPFESGGSLLQNMLNLHFDVFQQHANVVDQLKQAIITP